MYTLLCIYLLCIINTLGPRALCMCGWAHGVRVGPTHVRWALGPCACVGGPMENVWAPHMYVGPLGPVHVWVGPTHVIHARASEYCNSICVI